MHGREAFPGTCWGFAAVAHCGVSTCNQAEARAAAATLSGFQVVDDAAASCRRKKCMHTTVRGSGKWPLRVASCAKVQVAHAAAT